MEIDLDGWWENRLRVCPHIDEKLDRAELALTLPCGMMRASFERRDGKIAYWIKVPFAFSSSSTVRKTHFFKGPIRDRTHRFKHIGFVKTVLLYLLTKSLEISYFRNNHNRLVLPCFEG